MYKYLVSDPSDLLVESDGRGSALEIGWICKLCNETESFEVLTLKLFSPAVVTTGLNIRKNNPMTISLFLISIQAFLF